MVIGLDGVLGDALGVAHRADAPLPDGPQVEVVLEQLAAQLAPRELEAGLQILVGEAGVLAAAQEPYEPRVERVGAREDLLGLARGDDLRFLSSSAIPALPFASRRARACR